MEGNSVKHLEMIQAVVTRLAQNSFAMKGWAVTLVAASFALGAKEGSAAYVLLALFPNLSFWGLDASCLRRERLYRCLFDAVRKGDAKTGPFCMDTKPYRAITPNWFRTGLSRTLLGLYLPMTAVIVGIALLIGSR